MSKFTKAAKHLTVEEIDKKIKATIGFWRVQRWMVIRSALVNPKPAKEIALDVGLSTQTVHNLISTYNRFGPSSVEVSGRGQRQRAYLTKAEEIEFLKPFIAKAEKGEIATILIIKKSLELLLGFQVNKSTVYRLLERNGWRKIVPRPKHPKRDIEQQKSFKKTLEKK